MANPGDSQGRNGTAPAGPSPSEAATTTNEPAGRNGNSETFIGAYQVLGPLEPGGMGDVCLAFDGRLKRHVAIKRIRAGSPTSHARERLRREAAAAASLNHPAIVQIYDILQEPDGEAIVMEYVNGLTLDQMLANGRLPVPDVVTIARQIAEGLAAAHAVGLIHRDLKTQNVKVTPAGQAKILDFGLAKRLTPWPDEDALTVEGAVVGTVRAMSPEQAQGRPLDPRSDLFSLGVLLYEICTGRSPFRGDGRVQTRLKVIAEPPPAVHDLNPDLPAPLADLINALLQKDPARRPARAVDVVERLREIEQWPTLRTADIRSGSEPAPRRRGVAVVVLLALAVVTTIGLLQMKSAWRRPLAVLVQAPKIASAPPDDRSGLAAFALKEAIVRALTGLEGVEPIGQDELPEGAVAIQDAARAAAADEIVVPTIDCQGLWCRVSLRRERARDAHILWNAESFDVSGEPEDSLALTNAVAIHVRAAFSDHRPQSTSPGLEVRRADYQRYLAVRRRMEGGEVLGREEIEELQRIASSSPGLIEAYVLSAATATGMPDRALAQRILQEADARNHDDPRLLYERFLLELETGKITDAEAALADLERVVPGDVRVWRARARLLTRQGKLQEAAEVGRRMVRDRPSWKNLWYVADVEIELADATAARKHLEQLLEVSPGNPRGLAKMAELEWLMGDPARAARIYESLLKEKVTPQNLSNLGWSLLLAGEYGAAGRAYEQALALTPDHLRSRINLGIANEGAGDPQSARRLYRDVLDRVAIRERTSALTVSDRLIKAQALARLGEAVPAVQLTIQALAEGDRDSQVVFQAAIIYALCSERNHAIVQAQEARRRGLSPRWFTIPGFESLRSTPAFRDLLAPA